MATDQATICFVGDLVGSCGRRTLLALLPTIRERYDPTFVVINGENVAGGLGITPKIADELFEVGVDVITLGNHSYRRAEILPYLDQREPILRPANYLRSQPGHGHCMVEKEGMKLGVINLSGNLFLDPAHPAFQAADSAVEDLLNSGADQILVDMHAEATSEKVALGWYLDGQVSAVVGTHTHIPTADARVLPGGTAFITDVGMTGARGGVIGVKRDQAVGSLVSGMRVQFEPSDDDPWLNAVIIRCRGPRRAESIEQLLLAAPASPREAL